MPVGTICSRVVATALPDESVRVAARRMVRNDVGTLVVLEGGGINRPVGLLTDRDITVRCVAGDLDPDHTSVSQVMTAPVHTVNDAAPVIDAVLRMASLGTRRLAVTDTDGRLAGLLSLDDVLGEHVQEVGAIGRLLEQQRPRIPA